MSDNGWPGEPGVPLNPERDGWHWVQRVDNGFVTSLSNSPSDKRAALNLRTQVRIAVKQEMERQQCR